MKNALQKAQKLAVEPYEFKLSQYFSRGWEIFNIKPGLFISFSILATLIIIVAAFIPFASLCVNGPLMAGYYIVARKIDVGETVEFGDFFKGFNYFVQLLLLGLISGILMGIGFICLIIPGIYLAVAYFYGQQLVIFGKLEFWDAMEASRKAVTNNWLITFGFMIVSMLVALAGFLFFGIGVFVAWPVIACASYAAFEDIFQPNESNPEDEILDHLIS